MLKEKLYDIFYDYLDKQQKKMNLCDFYPIKTNMSCCRDRKSKGVNGCCIFCEHFKYGKCQVKSLMCKMWMCKEIYGRNQNKKSFQKYLKKLETINKLIIKYDIPMYFRASKEQTFSGMDWKGRQIWLREKWYIDRVSVLTGEK